MEAKIIWIIISSAGLALAAWLPTDYNHRSLFPTDDPKYIRRVFGGHTVGQTFHTRYETDSIKLLMRRQHPQAVPLQFAVGGRQASTTVHVTEQDQWISLTLPAPLPTGEHELTLSAPEITDAADAILIRFQIDSTNFEPGYMVVDGQPSYGDIAFQFIDRIPAWMHIPRYFTHHRNHGFEILRVAILSSVLSILTFIIPWSRKTWRYALFALVVFSVTIRIPTLAQIDGVFGGDAFNYLSKAKAWTASDDPFNADPRKGPLLSLILTPTLLTKNPILWSRFIGAIFAGITAAATAAALRQLKLSFPLAFLGGMLVSVNRELWWESLNGLANVPYAALTAISTWGLVASQAFATSFFAVLATLTRYEGIITIAIYLPALWLINRFRFGMLRRSLVPLLLLAIPFVFWPISGALGIRTVSDIASDTGLYIAWDWGDYLSNLDKAKAFLQELWFFRHEPPMSYVTDAIYLTTILGGALLIKRRPIVGLAILALGLSQVAAITAMLPKTRYYVQVIPLLAVGCVYSLSLLPRRLSIATASLLVASVWINSYIHLPKLIEAYNYRGRGDSVLLQASVFLKKIDSRPAFATNFFSIETVFPLQQVVMGAPEDEAEQINWLKTNQATHLVETSEYPWFKKILGKYPENFQRLTSFRPAYDGAQVIIYEIHGL